MKTLIQIENLSKHFGDRDLFHDACVTLTSSQKIGVIGRNGCGKSTLCRIITDQEKSDGGKVILNADLRLSYLQQDDPYDLSETVIGFLERFTGKPGWKCGKVAGRFQIKNETLSAPISSLAGGFRTRVKLISMLLTDPNFLIMDEPTNYLDLTTLVLLENFLLDFRGGFLIVSHDREFLKKTCEQTLEIENGKFTLYPGNVEQYLEYKAGLREQAIHFNRQVENKRAELERFVERFRAKATKAAQAKSKQKQIDRLQSMEISNPLSNVRIKIPPIEIRKGFSLNCENLSIGYPNLKVASDINLSIERGDHVAVLGDNGEGKTTFLRTIAGELEVKDGKFRWGHHDSFGYYAQHVFTAIAPKLSILDYLTSRAASGVLQQEILDLAGSFLFQGEDVRKKIEVLSGGEKARVCLAGLLLSKSRVLLLDEPTNHLDFETVEVLAQSLKKFNGTIFFISHDRTFVNLIASAILDVKGGRIAPYVGSYQDYVERIRQGDNLPARNISIPFLEKTKSDKKKDFKDRKKRKTQIQSLQNRVKKLDDRILEYRKERYCIETELTTQPELWSQEKSDRIETLNHMVEEQEAKWIKLSEKLEALLRCQN